MRIALNKNTRILIGTFVFLTLITGAVYKYYRLELNSFMWMMWPTEEDRPIIVFSKILGADKGRPYVIKDVVISTPEDWGVETDHLRKMVLDAFAKRDLQLKTRWIGAEANSGSYYEIQKRRGDGLREEGRYYRAMERVQDRLRMELISALPDWSHGPNATGVGQEFALLVFPTSYAGIGTFRLLILLLVINFCMLLATLFWRK